MGKIRVMSETLASQVAAGEVVERPASVIKELVENSLDAGAKHVSVEIARGGAAGMKVTDDGSGMSPDDARMSLQRHATSKLGEATDLAAIQTMGFRGEALPSVASVSRFRLATRQRGEMVGFELSVDGGEVVSEKESGCAEGTSVEVKELFYNIPARRKFLKAESTESAHVESQVRLHALAYPEVRFTFKKDGRVLFDLPATKDPKVRVSGLAGPGVMSDLVEVPSYSSRGVTVKGYVLKANHARKGRRHQFLFLNRRPIEDSALSGAIREGFGSVVGPGLNPSAWLWIEMDARGVDVNVHPAKKEVRFHKVHEVRAAVVEAVSLVLRPAPVVRPEVVSREIEVDDSVDLSSEPLVRPQKPAPTASGEKDVPLRQSSAKVSPAKPTHIPVQPELPDVMDRPSREGHGFKVVGPLSDRYFVLEGEEGLVLLDPISAQERVIYEQILASAQGQDVATQGLLVPIVLEVDERDRDIVLRHLEHFSQAGIDVEPFGAGTLQVTGLPAFLKEADAKALLLEFIDDLVESGGIVRKEMAFERFAGRLAGIASRQGKFMSSVEAETLLDSLFLCDLPFCGSDGRPTLVQLSLQELDRRFRRK